MRATFCDGCEAKLRDGTEIHCTVDGRTYDLCESCARLLVRLLKSKELRVTLSTPEELKEFCTLRAMPRLASTDSKVSPDSPKEEEGGN